MKERCKDVSELRISLRGGLRSLSADIMSEVPGSCRGAQVPGSFEVLVDHNQNTMAPKKEVGLSSGEKASGACRGDPLSLSPPRAVRVRGD